MKGLSVTGLSVARAGLTVVRGCSLQAPAGKLTVLLGPNGAGKTTLLEAISGVVRPLAGTIDLDGSPLGGLGRVRRTRLGIAHVEQGRTVFGALTVEENLRVATSSRDRLVRALELFPELRARLHVRAGHLSGGEQQMLVLARALACRPSLLLVDELSLGLAPAIVARLMPRLRELADEGAGVLLVEQYARLALEVGDRAYILSRGSVAYAGDCATLLERPDVLHDTYLSTPTISGNGHGPDGPVGFR